MASREASVACHASMMIIISNSIIIAASATTIATRTSHTCVARQCGMQVSRCPFGPGACFATQPSAELLQSIHLEVLQSIHLGVGTVLSSSSFDGTRPGSCVSSAQGEITTDRVGIPCAGLCSGRISCSAEKTASESAAERARSAWIGVLVSDTAGSCGGDRSVEGRRRLAARCARPARVVAA